MIYGRTNVNQTWEIKPGGEKLLHNESKKVLQIPDCLESLNSAANGKPFFYVFGFKKVERFVFVTKEEVSFRQLSSPHARAVDFAIRVDGALYDLEKKCFVFGDGKFSKFIIYDYGVPNVILDESSGKHHIFALKNGEYEFYTVKSNCDPIFVSHLWKDKGNMGRPVNNRLIFFYPNGQDDETMLILHEELEQESINENVHFEEVVYFKDKNESVASYFRSIHGKDGKEAPLSGDRVEYQVKLIKSGDAVIVRQPTEEKNIVFVEGRHFVYDDVYDCFKYEKMSTFNGSPCKENMLRVLYRKNDFENGEVIFNVTTGKIY